MKVTIPYQASFSGETINAKTMEREVEASIMKGLERVKFTKATSLVYICFRVDVPVKMVVAGTVILQCIRRKFPEFEPKALFINNVPSPALVVEIEFGSFSDLGDAFL